MQGRFLHPCLKPGSTSSSSGRTSVIQRCWTELWRWWRTGRAISYQVPGTRSCNCKLTDSKSSINGNFDPLCTQLQHSENLSCSANTCVPHQTSWTYGGSCQQLQLWRHYQKRGFSFSMMVGNMKHGKSEGHPLASCPSSTCQVEWCVVASRPGAGRLDEEACDQGMWLWKRLSCTLYSIFQSSNAILYICTMGIVPCLSNQKFGIHISSYWHGRMYPNYLSWTMGNAFYWFDLRAWGHWCRHIMYSHMTH